MHFERTGVLPVGDTYSLSDVAPVWCGSTDVRGLTNCWEYVTCSPCRVAALRADEGRRA